MRRGANGEDRFAGVQVVHKIFHLIVRQFAKTQQHDHQVGLFQRFHPHNIGLVVRIDRSIPRIDGEEHRALETVSRGQNPRKHGHPFLRTILLVAGQKNEVLAFAGPVPAFVKHPLLGAGAGAGRESQKERQG